MKFSLDRASEIGGKFLSWTPETGPCPISINDHVWFKRLCGLFETQAALENRVAELEKSLERLSSAVAFDRRHSENTYGKALAALNELVAALNQAGQALRSDSQAYPHPEITSQHGT